MLKQSADHGVTFTVATGTVTYADRSCHLEPKQIDILECLLDAYPRGVSKDALGEVLQDDHAVDRDDFQNLRVQIARMRRRFWHAGMTVTIVNRRGWGERNEYHLMPGVLPGAPAKYGPKPRIPKPGQSWPKRTKFFVVEGQQLVPLKRSWKFNAACGRVHTLWVRP